MFCRAGVLALHFWSAKHDLPSSAALHGHLHNAVRCQRLGCFWRTWYSQMVQHLALFRLTCSNLEWKAITLYTEWMVRKEVISSVELISFLVRWPSHLSIYSNSFRVMWIQIVHFNLAENHTLVLVSSATCGVSQSLGLVIDDVSQFSSQGFNARQILHGWQLATGMVAL